jgi:hypothetical protein
MVGAVLATVLHAVHDAKAVTSAEQKPSSYAGETLVVEQWMDVVATVPVHLKTALN